MIFRRRERKNDGGYIDGWCRHPRPQTGGTPPADIRGGGKRSWQTRTELTSAPPRPRSGPRRRTPRRGRKAAGHHRPSCAWISSSGSGAAFVIPLRLLLCDRGFASVDGGGVDPLCSSGGDDACPDLSVRGLSRDTTREAGSASSKQSGFWYFGSILVFLERLAWTPLPRPRAQASPHDSEDCPTSTNLSVTV